MAVSRKSNRRPLMLNTINEYSFSETDNKTKTDFYNTMYQENGQDSPQNSESKQNC